MRKFGRTFASGMLSAGLGSPLQLAGPVPAGPRPPSSTSSGDSFTYDRATPCLRWPELDTGEVHRPLGTSLGWSDGDDDANCRSSSTEYMNVEAGNGSASHTNAFKFTDNYQRARNSIDGKRYRSRKAVEMLAEPSSRVMSKLALLKTKDWGRRVARLTQAICNLDSALFVADILDAWDEQLHPTDLCFVVKNVGQTQWARALEVYEWLNLRRWYSPNPRMLATIVGVLGRAKQVALADELFIRAQPEIGDCVQVYNSIMSAHARQGDWARVEQIFEQMQESQVQPDLITFNIKANAQTKAGLRPGSAMLLLHEIIEAGLRPDIITYNTLISACTNSHCWQDGLEVFKHMRDYKCDPDIWTYNALITVFGKAGMVDLAEEYFKLMQLHGFVPDAVTYNATLSAFARSARVEQVEGIRMQMAAAGCREDEVTFNTLIHMYGKLGLTDRALQIYEDMKARTCRLDAITFTVLIDALGKAGLVGDAERVFQEMEQIEVEPSLQTYTAMICAYAKASLFKQAEKMYDYMQRSGVTADHLANSVMVDVFHKAGLSWRAVSAFQSLLLSGHTPSLSTCSIMLRVYAKEGMEDELRQLAQDMTSRGFDTASLSSSFARAGLWDAASAALKICILCDQDIDRDVMDAVLHCFAAANRFEEASSFVHSLYSSGVQPEISWLQEELITMLAKSEKFEEARVEFDLVREHGFEQKVGMYRALIVSYEHAGMANECVQLFQDMQSSPVQTDERCCKSAILAYCKIGSPDLGYELQQKYKSLFHGLIDSSVYTPIIEAFGKGRHWESAEKCFRELHGNSIRVCTKALNALLFAYAESGQYTLLRETFQALSAQGITTPSILPSSVLEALSSNEAPQAPTKQLQVVEALTVSPNKKTFIVLLTAFCKEGDIAEAKRVYKEMKDAGFVPQSQVFALLGSLFAMNGDVEDAENLLVEMEESGCLPDVTVMNAMISMYSKLGEYKKASHVYKGMQALGCTPDVVTYNILINLYSRHQMVTEAYTMFQEMLKAGFKPDVVTYTTLISGYGSALMWEACESLFKEMQEAGCDPNATTYHALLNAYRRVGMHEAAETTLEEMSKAGFEPGIPALHMLMDSYGKGGRPEMANKMMEKLRASGVSPTVEHYTALIDAYLKEECYELAASRLREMKQCGLTPNYVTFTCIVGAASRCTRRIDMLKLLAALRDVGFPLPFELITHKEKVMADVEELFVELRILGPAAGLGFVNVLEDLLWAFQRRATAVEVYQLAVKTRIYPDDLVQVETGKWGADLRRLSAGAALLVLSFWLGQMQEAALVGFPQSSKSVLLVTGRNRNSNRASLSKTLKAHLWEMGSPFLVSKTREGILMAKGHSLRHWLRDSPLCMDLELRDMTVVPAVNSMEMYNGAWMNRKMVPIMQQIEESMGDIRPQKYSRIARMEDEQRSIFIAADLKHHAEKVERDKRRKVLKKEGMQRRRKKLLFTQPKSIPMKALA